MKNKNTKTKQKRFNKRYAGKLTKRQKEINLKQVCKILIVSSIFATSYAFAMTENNYIIESNVECAKIEITEPNNSDLSKKKIPEKILPVMIKTKEQSNERQIREIAKEFNFQWTDYLVNLACCEGLLLTDTINDKGNTPWYSKDRGLYGINDHWHKEVSDECAKDLRCSTIWTMERINAGFQYEWMCDVKIRGNKNYTNKHCYQIINNK